MAVNLIRFADLTVNQTSAVQIPIRLANLNLISVNLRSAVSNLDGLQTAADGVRAAVRR